jgi:alpha-1,2-mannosyltransferase
MAVSRILARLTLACAGLVGVVLFALGVKAQVLRAWLYWRHGLGFADPYCTTGYCDYGMFWVAGVLLRHGQGASLYGPHYAALAGLPYKTGWWPFVYPPSVFAPAYVVALLPLVAGYYVVSAGVVAASVRLLRAAGLPWRCVVAGLVSFPAMWTLYLGQWGMLCGALLIYGLARVRERPLRAGAALGLLAVKPQYALLAPVAVLAARRWRAGVAGVAVLGALLLLSWALGGEASWLAYWGPGRGAMRALLEQDFPGNYEMMGSSAFWMLRSLHLSVPAAYAGQGLVSLACLGLGWVLWRRDAADKLVASAALPLLARAGAPWHNAALGWLWVAPAFVPGFVARVGFLPTPLLLSAVLMLAWRNRRCLGAETPGRALPIAEPPPHRAAARMRA